MIGIYSITNKINGMRYIGQSVNIQKRWSIHKSKLRNNKHQNLHLQRAWNKYGEQNFDFEVVIECEAYELDEKEMYYIKYYHANEREFGYCFEGGGNGNKSVSDETREKISQSLMGHEVSDESKEKMKMAHIGKHLSEETKRKVCDALRGREMSESAKQKLSDQRKGKPLSIETRRKLSESHKGHKWSHEQKARIKGARSGANSPNFGKHLSDETKEKISKSRKGKPAWNKGIPCSEEHKTKQSAAMKGRPSNRARRIMDLTTGIIYASVKEAKDATGFCHIDGAARGERNHAGGHQWKYIESCASAQ